MLLAMIVAGIMAPLWPESHFRAVAGGLAVGSLLLMVRSLFPPQALLAALIAMAGLAMTFLSGNGEPGERIDALLGRNVPLLSLLAGLSFLRLLTPAHAAGTDRSRSSGKLKGLATTMTGVHLFALVINLSALFIALDGIRGGRRPAPGAVVAMARSFGAAAFWSPFFVAMGVALEYAPASNPLHLALMGIAPALCVLGLTLIEYRWFRPHWLDQCPAVPVSPRGLLLPLSLVAGVLVLHRLLPVYPVVLIIAGLSLLLGLAGSLRREAGAFRRHVSERLPGMANELALFLSAGILAVGLEQVVQEAGTVAITGLGGYSLAAGSLLLLVLLALVGIHPVVTIAVIGSGLAQGQGGDLMGVTFLMGWGLGIVGGPLSGMNLALSGRYRYTARELVTWQLPHLLAMSLVCLVLLGIYGAVLA